MSRMDVKQWKWNEAVNEIRRCNSVQSLRETSKIAIEISNIKRDRTIFTAPLTSRPSFIQRPRVMFNRRAKLTTSIPYIAVVFVLDNSLAELA